MFFKMPPKTTEEQAERMGFDAELNGATTTNCHFSLFTTPKLAHAWEQGKKHAMKTKKTASANAVEKLTT